MLFPAATLLTFLPLILQASAQSSGKTTRYWDCCKASCGWKGKTTLASGSTPVGSCDKQDKPLTDFEAVSGCNNGGAYMCSNQSPWAVSETLAYGFAATSLSGGTESSWCCACYELTFTSGAVKGKKMIVQSTNTGSDLGNNHFDLAMPGGGFGIFNGCTAEWGNPSTGWGAQYGGISSRSQCDAFPAALKAGCYWRYDWFGNSDNPDITFKQVTCPAALTAKTGCVRNGEIPTGPDNVPTWSQGSSTPTATSTSTSTSKATSSSTSTFKATTSSTTTSVGAGSTPPASGGTVQQYGQCGGKTYSGPTACVAPYTCKFLGEYYSQCI